MARPVGAKQLSRRMEGCAGVQNGLDHNLLQSLIASLAAVTIPPSKSKMAAAAGIADNDRLRARSHGAYWPLPAHLSFVNNYNIKDCPGFEVISDYGGRHHHARLSWHEWHWRRA